MFHILFGLDLQSGSGEAVTIMTIDHINVLKIDENCCNGLFKKKITFLVRKFQKFCVWFLTLYAFIICKVIIRTQYYTNASLISAPVVILYQNVKVLE